MLKHLYLILIATFLLGFVCGGLVFLYNNTGTEGDGGLDETDTKEELSITAETYGGCLRGGGCASYRITARGGYKVNAEGREGALGYVYLGMGGDAARTEGELSSAELGKLSRALKDAELDDVAESTFRGTCPAFVDGVAYRYDIVYDGSTYHVDSCEQNLNVELFELLQNYFEVFNTSDDAV